jgi:NTE family protein
MPDQPEQLRQALDPVRFISASDQVRPPQPGIGLCLSGGGYRAMVFHLGCFLRLNELGYLRRLSRISSVSGGSICSAVLGMNWKKLSWDPQGKASNLGELVVKPVLDFATRSIDEKSILGGILNPFKSIYDEVEGAYKKFLFGDATLQDLPSDAEGPRFVINATNVQTKVLWRFSKPFMGDYKIGLIKAPNVPLALAVTASSAFPPILSPMKMKVAPESFDPTTAGPFQRAPFNEEVVLTDGGVYDNLGLETCWKEYDTIFVSDGGGCNPEEEHPHTDWARHAYRVLQLIDDQVGNLRKRWVIGSYEIGLRKGCYWGIRSNVLDYKLPDALPAPFDKSTAIANIPTRLKALSESDRNRLLNWGYAICDTAMRRHVAIGSQAPSGFPYPGGVG